MERDHWHPVTIVCAGIISVALVALVLFWHWDQSPNEENRNCDALVAGPVLDQLKNETRLDHFGPAATFALCWRADRPAVHLTPSPLLGSAHCKMTRRRPPAARASCLFFAIVMDFVTPLGTRSIAEA
jgi:hypothetical protein